MVYSDLVSVGEPVGYPFSVLRRNGVYIDWLKDQRFGIFYEDSTLTPLDDQQIIRSRAVGSVGVFVSGD